MNSKVSEQPGQDQRKIYSTKAQNTTIRSYLRQKVHEMSWLALLWHRAPNEVSENGTESWCPARTGLKTSTAILHSKKNRLKVLVRTQIIVLRGRHVYHTGLEQVDRFVIHEADEKKWRDLYAYGTDNPWEQRGTSFLRKYWWQNDHHRHNLAKFLNLKDRDFFGNPDRRQIIFKGWSQTSPQ